MKKRTYKTKKRECSEVQEPLAAYVSLHHPVAPNASAFPIGYMSLEQFGEIFHQKLDTCYENIHRDRQ